LFASPAVAQSEDLTGIAHVAFRVSDVVKSRDFYRTLGFEQAFEFADAGKTSVSYVKVSDRQFVELYQRKDTSQAIGLMHICFESSDLESLQKAYAARGIDAAVPRKARAGNLLSGVHDPDGQLIEYTQYLPGSLHSEDKGNHLSEHAASHHLWRVEFTVNDVASVEAFYIEKLGFEQIGKTEPTGIGLRLPGNSNEQVKLRSGADPKPGIVFEVRDVDATLADVRGRGLAAATENQRVIVTDPDGIPVMFAVATPHRKL
jgi:catechol 2,3-dioxygenase-like lactoylglutathione lyase family enzyme